MRAFIAVACPEDAKAELSRAAERMKSLGDMKIVEKENIHLTLRFLGEFEESKVTDVICALDSVRKQGGFDVCIKGLGSFPGPGSPRVLWAGAQKGDKELRELHEEIEKAITPLGFPADERFASHYTIARVKYLKDKAGLKELLAEYKEHVFGCFRAESFYLMKSELRRSGPVYSVVKEFPLQ
jgi:RNA 2',3'-cyclic 3'-phosphodiesterase